MKRYPCCQHCRHLVTDFVTGHPCPCPSPLCVKQMRETVAQAECPQRAHHATVLTPVMKAMRLELRPCGCGLRHATPITPERN